jgi:hypothetical protein
MKTLKIICLFIAFGYLTVYSQVKKSVIEFNDMTVTIKNIAPLDYTELNKIFYNDAEFTADIGAELELNKAEIIINAGNYSKIEIYQAYETSITISDEGPHCDLIDWKHYTSNWEMLAEIKKNHFKPVYFTESDKNMFPEVTMDEVKQAVKLYCGKNWVNLIKNAKSIYDYPIGVGISRIYLKIYVLDKYNNLQTEKNIIILIPMGC